MRFDRTVKSKIDTRNTGYRKSGGHVEVFSEPIKIKGIQSKINTFNNEYIKSGDQVQV